MKATSRLFSTLSFFVFVAATGEANCLAAPVNKPRSHCDFVALLTQQIAAGRDEDMRIYLADDLAEYLRDFPQCGKDQATISDVTRFLEDKNDGVRAGAAQALGNIGPPAKSAIPALERALKQSDAQMQSTTSVILPRVSLSDVIKYAIERIRSQKQPTR